MSTDQTTAYAYCPGGTGKKIKFCCRDLLPELSSVQRMAEGEQFTAALQHVDRLLASGKERPCLLAWRGLLLRALGRGNEIAANAERFLAQYPDNRVALADMASVLANQGKATEALRLLHQALAKADEVWEEQIFDAVLEVAQALCSEQLSGPGRSLLLLALNVDKDNYVAQQMLRNLYRSTSVSLLAKETFQGPPCPAEVPWKKEYDDLAAALQDGRWCKTVDRFVQFAEQHPDSVSVAGLMVGLWSTMGDAQRCRQAADRFAAMAQDWEDAAEALAVAMLVDDDPLGDLVDVFHAEWEVSDPEKFEQAMLGNPCVVCEPVDYRSYDRQGESPPPKALYRLLDRPPPGGEPTLENIPIQLAKIEYYGRQTDRPARLSFQPLGAPAWETVKEALLRTASGAMKPEPTTQMVWRDSASLMLFRTAMYCPLALQRHRQEELRLQHLRRVMLEQWPDQPLGVLGGLTPRSAAADLAKRLLVQAVIKVVEGFIVARYPLDFNELRAALGLELAPPVESLLDGRENIPLIRLHRVAVERFSAEQLNEMLVLAFERDFRVAAEKLAAATVRKPDAENSPVAMLSLWVLVRSCQDPQQQLEYIRKGRALTLQAGRSDHLWDMFELENSMMRNDVTRFKAVFSHLAQEHMYEEGVAEHLQYFMAFIERAARDVQAQQQAAADATTSAPQAAGLWMPGQDQGGGGKLWTPDE